MGTGLGKVLRTSRGVQRKLQREQVILLTGDEPQEEVSPGGLALFTPPGQEDRIGQFQSIAFWCDDLFATAKILKSKGVQFTKEPKSEAWGSSSVFRDPDGNQFALSSK